MQQLVVILLLGAGVVACLVKAGIIDLQAAVTSAKQSMQPYATKPLLTPNELSFYRLLVRALPDYVITPQTAMGALIAARGHGDDGPSARSVRATFDRKIVDFCIVRRETFEVLALVELDDRMHSPGRDAKRDDITVKAGYRTLRFFSATRPDAELIRSSLAAALAGPPKVHFVQYGGPTRPEPLWAAAAAVFVPKDRDRR